MIEIRKNENLENHEMEYKYNLYLDGVLCEGAGVYIEDVDMQYGLRVLEVKEQLSTEKLKKIPLSEFYEIEKLNFYSWKDFDVFSLRIEIDRFNSKLNQVCSTTFKISPELSFWKKSFNFAEYQELFNGILNDKFSELNLIYGNNKYNEFSEIIYYVFHDFSNAESIDNELKKYEIALIQTHQETIETLQSHITRESLLTSFDFPEELKAPCEQYLLYFAQFLRDLGINATSNLKEEAGKVLFSITPSENIEALDKIREALAVYLNLPSSPIVFDESFAAIRLQQQIENLQHSQRMAARELQFSEKLLTAQSDIIQEKNVTISQLQSNNEQQAKIIEKITSSSIMMDSVENKEQLEKIYDGLQIGESKTLKEWLGIHLNPAKLIKTGVKNAFWNEGETITVLGLDKKTEKENN